MLAKIHNETWPTREKRNSRIDSLPEHTYIDRIEKLLSSDSNIYKGKLSFFFARLFRDIIIHKEVPRLVWGREWKTGGFSWKVRCHGHAEGLHLWFQLFISLAEECVHGCSLHNSVAFEIVNCVSHLSLCFFPQKKGSVPFPQWTHSVEETHIL